MTASRKDLLCLWVRQRCPVCYRKGNPDGAKVVTLSDSNGYIYDPDGINEEKLSFVKNLKNVRRGRIREYADKYGCTYVDGKATPWDVPCQVALRPQHRMR